MQPSPTRLKKQLHIWQEGLPQDVYYTLQPDDSKMVVFVSPEAAQTGIAALWATNP